MNTLAVLKMLEIVSLVIFVIFLLVLLAAGVTGYLTFCLEILSRVLLSNVNVKIVVTLSYKVDLHVYSYFLFST